MKRETNRTFYFIETDDGVLVGSKNAPLWNRTFATLSEAVEAVRKRNSKDQGCKGFHDVKNGIVAVYEGDNTDE